MNRKKIINSIMIAIASVIFIYLCYKSYVSIHKIEIFSSAETLKNFLLQKKGLAPIIFFLIQVLQIIVSPIPGNVTTLAGGVLFGPFISSILSCSAITLGSAIAFYLARKFGKPLVSKFVSRTVIEKYDKVFSSRSQIILFIFFLVPFFPDDALCFLSGLSNMSFSSFITLVILGRSPGTIFASLAGSGIIHMSLNLWIVLIIVSLILIFLYIRYSKSIEDYVLSKVKNKHGN